MPSKHCDDGGCFLLHHSSTGPSGNTSGGWIAIGEIDRRAIATKNELPKLTPQQTAGFATVAGALLAQTGPPAPGLFFREDWNRKEPFEQVTQAHVSNPDLIHSTWGPGRDGVRKRHRGTDENPYYICSGACPDKWARQKPMAHDAGRISFRTRDCKFHFGKPLRGRPFENGRIAEQRYRLRVAVK